MAAKVCENSAHASCALTQQHTLMHHKEDINALTVGINKESQSWDPTYISCLKDLILNHSHSKQDTR